MCEYCSTVELNVFHNPDAYENTVRYIKNQLIEKQHFIFAEGNCEIGCHKNSNGCWVDDIIYHVIKCPECGQVFTCSVDTYHGGGSFKKGR